MSSTAWINTHPNVELMDEPALRRDPATISDEHLLALNDRLARIQRLGGAFADLKFSPQATDRLRRLRSRVQP